MRLLLLPIALFVALPAAAQNQRVAIPTGSRDTSSPIGTSTIAQPPATVIVEPAAMMIAAFDADDDARVTRAEFDAGLRRSFESARPQNGSIGYIGYSDWSERWMGDRNTLPSPFEIDRDGDNRITFDELAARFDQLFARYDVDKDNILVRRELVTIRPQMADPRMRGGKPGKPRR